MISKTFEVASFSEFHETIQEILRSHSTHRKNTIYRGHKSLEYKLIPKVGRIEKFRFIKLKIGQDAASSLMDQEKYILREFKNRSLPLLPRLPVNDWEWLAIGQHHGLAARLLDWSKSPLVAAYFAVEKNYEEDSAVYSYNRGFYHYEDRDPFHDVSEVERITPASYTRRIEVQSGVFTVHNDPKKPLEDIAEKGKLHKIIIVKSFRDELREILANYGIHRASMFPDLDGMAYFINDYCVKKWT